MWVGFDPQSVERGYTLARQKGFDAFLITAGRDRDCCLSVAVTHPCTGSQFAARVPAARCPPSF